MPKKRSKRDASKKFVSLHWWELTAAAYGALDSTARDLYTGVKYRYNGQNNGYISMSVREAAQWTGRTVNTARRALAELEAKGFVQCMQDSRFNVKDHRAREWRLTCLPCDRTGWPATKEFRHWEPGVDFRERYHSLTRAVSHTDTVSRSRGP